MDLQIKNKIIIVTGGAKGIGEAISRKLAAEGALPVIIGRNQEDNEKVVAEIEQAGGKAFQVVAELVRPKDCKDAVDAVIAKFGAID